MLASSHHLALAMSLLTGAWLARTTLAVSCDIGELVDRKQCIDAVASIVYDKPQNTLDRVSSRFAKLSGNCTAGENPLFNSVYLLNQNHQSEHDTNYFPPRTLACGLNIGAPLTVDKDCQDAFNSISVDSKGRLLGDKGTPAPSILKTLKTCTVLIYTTDDSPLIAKKSEIGAVVSKTIKECKGKSGVIGLAKGASGNNGLAVVRVRSSLRCGSRADSGGQYCAP